MVRLFERRQEKKNDEKKEEDSLDGDRDNGDDGDDEDDDEKVEESTRNEILRDNLPGFDADLPEAADACVGSGEWAGLNAVEKLSSAGPCSATQDRRPVSRADAMLDGIGGIITPPGYDWEGRNLVSQVDGRKA